MPPAPTSNSNFITRWEVRKRTFFETCRHNLFLHHLILNKYLGLDWFFSTLPSPTQKQCAPIKIQIPPEMPWPRYHSATLLGTLCPQALEGEGRLYIDFLRVLETLGQEAGENNSQFFTATLHDVQDHPGLPQWLTWQEKTAGLPH